MNKMTNDETIKNDLLTMEAYDFYLKHKIGRASCRERE